MIISISGFRKLVPTVAIAAIIAGAFFLGGCKGGNNAPDVSDIKVDVQTRRLDRDLVALDTNNLGAGLSQLQQKYPDFLNFYLDTLMSFGINGNFNDTAEGVKDGLSTFLTHKDYRGLFDTIAKHFPDTKQIDEDLKRSFQYMKYYYPAFKVPKVVYFNTGLNNWSAITYEDIAGIGLDMYLGENFPYYGSVGIPSYMTKRFYPQFASVNLMTAEYYNMHPFIMENRNLLDMMIQRGKQAYFLEKVMPFTEDTLRFGFSKSQMDWCKENEAMVYNFFLKNNLIYETNWQKVVRYVNDGPSATGMPAQSPGNIGTWLGYQIVSAYMEQHPGLKMEELFKLTDAQRILQESKYKPK